jgi:hypothetical protein
MWAGVFVRLNASAPNCRLTASVRAVFLNNEKSKFVEPGPRPICRAEFPNISIGAPVALGTVPGTRNAAGLKY